MQGVSTIQVAKGMLCVGDCMDVSLNNFNEPHAMNAGTPPRIAAESGTYIFFQEWSSVRMYSVWQSQTSEGLVP